MSNKKECKRECPDCGEEYPKSWNFCTNKDCDRVEAFPWADDIPEGESDSTKEEPESTNEFYDRLRKEASEGIEVDMADTGPRAPKNI